MKTMAEALTIAAETFRGQEAHHQSEADKIEPRGEPNDQRFGDLVMRKTDLTTMAHASRKLAEMCEEVIAARPYQHRVHMWMLQCFGLDIARDEVERGDRLLEEVFELLQSRGYDFSRIPQVANYVAARPVGEPGQELGGVMVCIFAAANAYGLDVGAEAERELTRISEPETMAKIRAKQAAKPSMSPLPQ